MGILLDFIKMYMNNKYSFFTPSKIISDLRTGYIIDHICSNSGSRLVVHLMIFLPL